MHRSQRKSEQRWVAVVLRSDSDGRRQGEEQGATEDGVRKELEAVGSGAAMSACGPALTGRVRGMTTVPAPPAGGLGASAANSDGRVRRPRTTGGAPATHRHSREREEERCQQLTQTLSSPQRAQPLTRRRQRGLTQHSPLQAPAHDDQHDGGGDVGRRGSSVTAEHTRDLADDVTVIRPLGHAMQSTRFTILSACCSLTGERRRRWCGAGGL